MTVDTPMLAASIGKTFVGATVIALAREGRLDLDAPLSCWLGERDWFERLPNHAAISLRNLLNHRSGLPDHVYTAQFRAAMASRGRDQTDPPPPEALIGFVLDAPPLFAAGEGWAYSDTGYLLLGMVIEAATGRSYYDEVSRRFLAPLALSRTSPSDQRDLPGLAAGYMAADNVFGLPPKTIDEDGTMNWHPGAEWAGGGLASTAIDLARWGWLLFGGRAMSAPYLDDLLRAEPIGSDAPDIAYGAGVSIHRDGPFGPSYSHAGWIPGYTASLRYYAEHQVAIAFMINTDIGLVGGDGGSMRQVEEELARVILIRSPDGSAVR
jgi:D-alanyl-D-alanine carboxypeptidase